VTHKIIIVAFTVIEALTVLMAEDNVLFSCTVIQYLPPGSMKYL